MSKGISMLANYTWSKSLDNIPMRTDLTNVGIGGWYVMPITMPGYEALDHGPSDFDVRHVASISYVWQIPNLSNRNWFVRGATNGWALNGIVSVQSGLPLTVEAGQDRSQTGIGYDRGVLVSNQTYQSGPCANVAPCVNWLNPQAFALPALGTFGNIGKGSLRMPGLWNWDMTMAKSFLIKERVSVQFRADFFNVFNHTNFGTGATSNTLTAFTVAGAGFGTIRAARDPRIGQMSLKVTF